MFLERFYIYSLVFIFSCENVMFCGFFFLIIILTTKFCIFFLSISSYRYIILRHARHKAISYLSIKEDRTKTRTLIRFYYYLLDSLKIHTVLNVKILCLFFLFFLLNFSLFVFCFLFSSWVDATTGSYTWQSSWAGSIPWRVSVNPFNLLLRCGYYDHHCHN